MHFATKLGSQNVSAKKKQLILAFSRIQNERVCYVICVRFYNYTAIEIFLKNALSFPSLYHKKGPFSNGSRIIV